MSERRDDKNGRADLRRTELLGWCSVGVVGSALVPAALVAAGFGRPAVVALLVLLLGAGLFGLMLWYLRVRLVVRKLSIITQDLEAKSKQQEEALKTIRELEAAQKTFMKMSSHQLRAPLAAMLSCLKVLLTGSVSDREDVEKLLHDAHVRGEDMLNMVDDMLSMSQAESGVMYEMNASVEDIDIEPAVREIADFFAARAAEKNVRYVFNVESPPGSIKANRKLFNQVVLNLISNAFRYSFPDTDVVITLASTDRDTVMFEVQNWGIIIPEEDMKFIFREFWRSDAARRHVERGTGLGLSIVKNIIDFRGGTISVKSDEKDGTRFRIEIPRTRKRGKGNGEKG